LEKKKFKGQVGKMQENLFGRKDENLAHSEG